MARRVARGQLDPGRGRLAALALALVIAAFLFAASLYAELLAHSLPDK